MIFDLSKKPLELWLYAERYLSNGARSYSSFAHINEMDAFWQPWSDVQQFTVPSVWVKKTNNEKFIFKTETIVSLANFYSPEPNIFLLPIHPATISLIPSIVSSLIEKATPGPNLIVSPTSSTRTVYVHQINNSRECPPHFLKLHFPSRISRFTRLMTRENVDYELWINEQVQRATLPHLPDLGGGYALTYNEMSIGFLLRSIWPINTQEDSYFIFPGFSLYSGDLYASKDPPLLAQLPRFFREPPAEFVIKRIIIPTIDLWFRIVNNLGIIPELHGQNVLFCFDRNCLSSSICFRDSDMYIDYHLRKKLGYCNCESQLELDNYLPISTEQILSLSYDGFLVHHFLSFIADFMEKWFGISASKISNAARYAFQLFGGNKLPLTDKVFYYDDCLYDDEHFVLTEHPQFELWR